MLGKEEQWKKERDVNGLKRVKSQRISSCVCWRKCSVGEPDFLLETDHQEKLLWHAAHGCKVLEFEWNVLNHSSAQHCYHKGWIQRWLWMSSHCFLLHNHGRTQAPLPFFPIPPLKELAHVLMMSCATVVYLVNSDFWPHWTRERRDSQRLCGLCRQDRQSVGN